MLDEKSRILGYLKQRDEALQIQAQAVQLNEFDPDLLQNYAWQLRHHQQIEQAEESLLRALTYRSHDHT